MKTFVAAIIILALLVTATMVNASVTKNAVGDVEKAVRLIGDTADNDNAEKISKSLKTLEEKRAVLHLSIRHTHIDQLAQLLHEAYAYCLTGDAPSMNAALAAALYKLERWKKIESFTLYNVL